MMKLVGTNMEPACFFSHTDLEVPYPKSEGDVFSMPDGRFIWSFFFCVAYPGAYDGYVYDTET